MTPSHYLNQCWITINGVLWHSPERNLTGHVKKNQSATWVRHVVQGHSIPFTPVCPSAGSYPLSLCMKYLFLIRSQSVAVLLPGFAIIWWPDPYICKSLLNLDHLFCTWNLLAHTFGISVSFSSPAFWSISPLILLPQFGRTWLVHLVITDANENCFELLLLV